MRSSTISTVPPAARGLTVACLETLRGMRALHQIRPWMERTAFEGLVNGQRPQNLVGIGRIRYQMPTDSSVEATALLKFTNRWLACAVRLEEQTTGQWKCSAFQLVGWSQQS